MMTPYSATNQTFSDRAHALAQRVIYPQLFEVDRACLSFDDVTGMTVERNRVLDGEMAVDKIVNVTIHGLQAPLVFTVQERFRRPDKAKFQDITITEWNLNSGLPSELYKIRAGLFLYGYYDERHDRFIDQTVVVNVPSLLMRIAARRVAWQEGRNPRSNQRFLTFPFTVLEECGTVELRLAWPK